MDWLNVTVGKERTGKSTLGWQNCEMADDDFNSDKVAFTAKELKYLLKTVPNFSAVMIDEAQYLLYSREAMKAEVRELNKTLMKIGGRNLFIQINIPDYFSLDVYIRKFRVMTLNRTRWRIESVVEDGITYLDPVRGKFHVYDKSTLKGVYKIKDTGMERWGAPTYVDHFSAIDQSNTEWQRYLKRKDEFMRAEGDNNGSEPNKGET